MTILLWAVVALGALVTGGAALYVLAARVSLRAARQANLVLMAERADVDHEIAQVRHEVAQTRGMYQIVCALNDQLIAARQAILCAALPAHDHLIIEHQPQAVRGDTVDQWLAAEIDAWRLRDVDPEDAEQMCTTGEVWRVSWRLGPLLGSCMVVAATLDRAVDLARARSAELGAHAERPERAEPRGG